MVQTTVLVSVLLVTVVATEAIAENNARLTTFGTNNKNNGGSNNNNNQNNSHAATPGVVEIVSSPLVGGDGHSAKLTTFGTNHKNNDEGQKNRTKNPGDASEANCTQSDCTTGYRRWPKGSQENSQGSGIVYGKVCKTDSECTNTQNTSCMFDHRDNQHRCMCLDRAPIKNGGCNIQYRGLLIECSSSSECLDNAECVPGNMTTGEHEVQMMKVVGLVNKTVCWCKDGFEHDDDFKKCNSGAIAVATATLLLAVNCILLGLQRSEV